MKLYNLSASQTSPCVVVKFKGCSIMLDCCLDLKSVRYFLPLYHGKKSTFHEKSSKQELKDEGSTSRLTSEIKEIFGRAFVDSSPEFSFPEVDLLDLSTVDAILLSNFSSITALPFITEYCGFKGQVYATEPTKQFGRLIMEELVEFCNKVPKDNYASVWKDTRFKRQLPSALQKCHEQRLTSWRQMYTADDLYNSMQKITDIAYAEKLTIFGALNVTAYSSGYAIGSCNWTIESDFEKIVYMSDTSRLPSHPHLLEDKPLHNADLLLFTGLTESPAHDPSRTINEFSNNILRTAKQGGNSLVPCLPCGVLFDLLEHLVNVADNSDCRDITIYLVSPSAKASLAFSQIYAEWLHQDKQNKAYVPELPFAHEELTVGGKLRVLPSIKDGATPVFKQPCVVFASHPSLRFGDAVHFMQLWCKSPLNSIFFVESGYSHVEALAPYQPVKAKTFYLPVDSRLDHAHASTIINRLAPRRIVVPPHYTSPPPPGSLHAVTRSELKLNTKCRPTTLDINSVMKMDIQREFEKVHLKPELAESVTPRRQQAWSKQLFAPISARLFTVDSKNTFWPMRKRRKVGSTNPNDEPGSYHRPLCVGKLSYDTLFAELIQDPAFSDAKLDASCRKITMGFGTIEESDGDGTMINYNSLIDEKLRNKLTELILRSLRED